MKLFWLEQQQSDLPGNLDWLGPREMVCLDRMRFPKRRGDWLLGRWTAKHAIRGFLESVGEPDMASLEIIAAPSGEPRAFADREPLPVTISISHRAAVAMCAVTTVGMNIGCDLELIEQRSAAFESDYFSADEQALIANSDRAQRDLLLNLLWSSKESAMKALRQGLRLNPRSVRISLAAIAEHATSGNWAPLRVHYGDEWDFCGYWSRSADLLRTIVARAQSLELVALLPPAKSLTFLNKDKPA